jgi:hypothetical protein
VPLLDDEGEPVTRWDGETTKKHPVTGEDVPDERAQVPVYRYVNPRKAEWPEADFIVGNPPYIGNKRMRIILGTGYVDALREAFSDALEGAHYVMYWWSKAADLARQSEIQRFGLITTNTLGHISNRKLLDMHLRESPALSIVFAVPDHPWVDGAGGAAVRVAMTVGTAAERVGTVGIVIAERSGSENDADLQLTYQQGIIRSNLQVGSAGGDTVSLRANERTSFMGVTSSGKGFRLTEEDLRRLAVDSDHLPPPIRRFIIGRDITQRPSPKFLIDFHGFSHVAATTEYPQLAQRLLDSVKAHRDARRGDTIDAASYAAKWWLLAKGRPEMRAALSGLRRYIAVPETSNTRIATFLGGDVLPDHTIFAIASDDAFLLGVLNSAINRAWIVNTGSRMGVGNDLRWRNKSCFDPFPFPDPDEFTKQRIRNLGEQLDAHRKRQQEQHSDLTITGMYNVLEKLRSGEALTAKEKKIHEQGLVSVLKQIHDDLDAAVFDAYGWPHGISDEEILERLVALNAERASEERRGIVRWLRPEFQNPSGTAASSQTAIALEEAAPAGEAVAGELPEWPKELRDQVSAVRDLFTVSQRDRGSWTAEEVARAFRGARRVEVASVLEALASLGILLSFHTPGGRQWRAA